MKNKYILKEHILHVERLEKLYKQLEKLKKTLSDKEYKEHSLVKLTARIRHAETKIIPENPDKAEFKLRGNLRKYRRYKQGLQRYRIIFCFANNPVKVIIYLYINTEKNLRNSGDKKDPYLEFSKLLKKGTFSHNPNEQQIQTWIKSFQQ